MAALLVETHCVWVRVVLDGPTSPLVQLLDLFGESVGRWVGGLVGWWVGGFTIRGTTKALLKVPPNV